MALVDVPQPGQTLGATQNPIRQNFLTINAAFAVDHIGYNLANQGQHQQISLALMPPGPVTSILTSNGFFAQNYATTTQDEIWVQTPSGANINQYPMTASILSNNAAPLQFSAGWTYLPSGILVKWGRNASGVGFNLNGMAGQPNFNQTFQATVTPFAAAADSVAYTIGPSPNFMMAVYSGLGGPCSWVVWGF